MCMCVCVCVCVCLCVCVCVCERERERERMRAFWRASVHVFLFLCLSLYSVPILVLPASVLLQYHPFNPAIVLLNCIRLVRFHSNLPEQESSLSHCN